MAKYSSPIVGGTTDNGDPAVVAIINNNQGYLCTGTLIDTDVVLTAGHCTEDTVASHYQVGGGVDPVSAATFVANATTVAHHPSFDPNNIQAGFDTGVLVLDLSSVQGTLPAPLAWQSATDDAAYAAGTTFTAVGYGITSGGGSDSGTKRKVTLTISQEFSNGFEYGSATANTCNGDSGGPAINGAGKVIGTTSFGDQNCTMFGADMRTDFNESFIATYASTTLPTPTPSGPTPTPTPGATGTPKKNEIAGVEVPSCEVGGFGGTAASLLPVAALSLLLVRRRRQ
jgi:secreted trypsin-like serine protease